MTYFPTRAIRQAVEARGSALITFTSEADVEYMKSQMNDQGFTTDVEHHTVVHAKNCDNEMKASVWTLMVTKPEEKEK